MGYNRIFLPFFRRADADGGYVAPGPRARFPPGPGVENYTRGRKNPAASAGIFTPVPVKTAGPEITPAAVKTADADGPKITPDAVKTAGPETGRKLHSTA